MQNYIRKVSLTLALILEMYRRHTTGSSTNTAILTTTTLCLSER